MSKLPDFFNLRARIVMHNSSRIVAALIIPLLLTACGGGDAVAPPAATASGSSDDGTTPPPGINVTGALQFVSASPTTIALKGTGGTGRTEISRITFRLLDSTAQPLGGSVVNFSLSTAVGGLYLSTTSATSDPSGIVTVDVHAGTISTTVKVIASTTTGTGVVLTAQSDNLYVSTGLADQDSFSLSVDTPNPEGWNYDGEISTFTIRVADHFNNPVPDGTAIYFTTEGGAIQPSCTTLGGACSVTWISQAYRPTSSVAPDRAGLVTILATTIGEESFSDVVGDGYFDNTDFAAFSANPILDLPEAWRDDNLNGTREPTEPFNDFNTNGLYGAVGNGIYNGILCSDSGVAAGVCTKTLLNVRASYTLAMSGSFAFTSFFADATLTTPIQVICMRDELPGWVDLDPVDGCPDAPGQDAGASCTDIGEFYVVVEDINGNSMPKGTTIVATSSLGSMLGTSSYTVENGIDPFIAKFGVQEVCGGVPAADMQLVVTTPNGNVTNTTFKILDDG